MHSYLDNTTTEATNDIMAQQKQHNIPKMDTEACFMGIPVEIRRSIFKPLLVNPILEEKESVSCWNAYGTDIRYGLSPSILGVCSQIYHEASDVLYGTNKFFMACLPCKGPRHLLGSALWEGNIPHHSCSVTLSPLTRYFTPTLVYSPIPTIVESEVAHKVRKWKVIISALDNGFNPTVHLSFLDFCRAIYRSAPNVLQVGIVKKGLEDGGSADIYTDIPTILEPLKLLRGVGTFELRDAQEDETLDFTERQGQPVVLESHLQSLPVDEKATLEQLVQSPGCAESAFWMIDSLITYAQCFEQYLPFKLQMGLDKLKEVNSAALDPKFAEFGKDGKRNPGNPYRLNWNEPLEKFLWLAKIASDDEDLEQFKFNRDVVITGFEGQYQKILQAALIMSEFVKEEKREGGLLDAGNFNGERHTQIHDGQQYKLHIAMVLIEDYTEAFRRDLSFQTKLCMRRNKAYFEDLYAETPIFQQVGAMSAALDRRHYDTFLSLFSSTVDCMDSCYLDMRETRKQLFGLDFLYQEGCDVDFSAEFGLLDEPIDWMVNEPDFAVREGLEPLGWEDDDDMEEEDAPEAYEEAGEANSGEFEGSDDDKDFTLASDSENGATDDLDSSPDTPTGEEFGGGAEEMGALEGILISFADVDDSLDERRGNCDRLGVDAEMVAAISHSDLSSETLRDLISLKFTD